MFTRQIMPKVIQLFQKFPVVGITGPRQSGKTTLAKEAFPHLPYVTMEDFDIRSQALEDPRGFLNIHGKNGLIIDEIQHVPQLFSYIQTISDERDTPGQFVVTGSHNFLLLEKISQTLAGRIGLFTLLPLSYQENEIQDISNYVVQGAFPRVHRYQIDPQDFYPNYLQTYIERDVRLIQSITDLGLFQKFIKLCAGRIGQLLNITSLASECGISHTTARAWLSVLEASYIIFLLPPYFKKFNKRLMKSPKLYFYDTGIACHLLGIKSQEVFETHHMKGGLFENLIILEMLKSHFNHYTHEQLYFWRDQTGHEIDVLTEHGLPIEIKSGQTINGHYFSSLKFFLEISDFKKGLVVYGGPQSTQRHDIQVVDCKTFLKNYTANYYA